MKKILIIILSLNCFFAFGQKIHFAHVTDTHVGGQTGASDLEKTIEDINSQKEIDFVLLTGDITEFGSDEELLQAKNIIEKLNIPFYALPGNHDSKWSESGDNSFVTIFGSERFSFERNGIHFIGTASGPNMRMAPGLVPREQIVFLDSVLKYQKDPNQPVIFVNHYPLDEALSNWYEITDRLHSVNIKATLLGHGHRNHLYNFEGIPGVMGRSNLQTKTAEVGYNLVTIEKDTMFYAERLSSGKTLPVWCKIPVGKGSNINSNVTNSGSTNPSKSFPRPDYSSNQKYTNVKELGKMQDKSDIGTGISSRKNLAIYGNAAGEIVALDINSGKKIWSFPTGGKIFSTPAISGNKVVCASTDHNIYCLDLKTGKMIWMHPTIKPIVACAAIEDGKVYIGSSDGSFRCISLDDGRLFWKFEGVENFVECKPLILKNDVCFGSWGNTFYSLNKSTGKLNWAREKYSNRMLSPAAVWPVAANGKIFLVAPDRRMTALDEKTGKEIWDSEKYSCRESIGISSDHKLVYIKNMTGGNVDAFFTDSADQKLAWECPADLGYDIAPSPIIDADNNIYVPTSSGMVVAIDKKTHRVAWKHKVSNALINSITPVGKRRLLISVLDGQVVCLM
ncbi:MAG: PQQ-binding-like beta-propeller repeat protein, partial [Prolixibacteraceae bacterium]